jgi:dCTP deaminase
MAIMPDSWIREQSLEQGMIAPFEERTKQTGTISYGLSSYGYDCRVSDEFMIFTNVDNAIVDPKDFNPASFVTRKTDICIIPPNSFVLARTVETFKVPRDVLVICLGKSTYARCGLIVNVTPLEPEWEGQVTLEISNTTPLPAKVYANEGIAQFLFFRGDSICEVSYADRAGKYMGQKGVTLPRM